MHLRSNHQILGKLFCFITFANTSYPASGTEKDFTNPVKYIVTAEDGTQQQYTVNLTVSKPADKDMLGFYISGELSNIWGTINGETNIIHMEVPALMNITKLTPVVVVSPTATVSPASGTEQDFSKPVPYTVTAQDGSVQEFTVIVEKKSVDEASPRLVTTIKMSEDNNRPYRYLEYDNQDRLIHYTETAPGRPGQEANMDVVKIVYGANGQIVKLIKLEDAETAREHSRTLNITYPDNKTIHVTEQLAETISKLDIITLDDAGKVSKFIEDGETEIFEYDAAGNLIRLTGTDGIYKTITYDNKNGIFKHGNTPQWLWLYTIERLIGIGANNSLSVNTYTPSGQLIESIDYEYKYNPISDYPNAYSYRKGNDTMWTAMFYSSIKGKY